MSRVHSFVRELSTCRIDHVFNPYAETCPEHDRSDAAAIRRRNLRDVIEATLAIGVSTMWFGRDLGYRGGRRTGLALTDEAHLHVLRQTLGTPRVIKATSTDSVAERTAQEIWRMVRCLPQPPFLWNVFPFHPHEPNNPMTNRRHTLAEARLAEDILATVLRWFAPERVVALGQDAYKALTRLGYEPVAVRHPSYGGQAAFLFGIRALYGLPTHSPLMP